MALLSNKTPIECMLGNFEKNDIKKIYEPAVNTLTAHAPFRNAHFAYALEPFLKKKLTQVGIELYPNGYIPHSHPFSKTLENHLLLDVLPNLLDQSDFFFCTIKEKKFSVFKARANLNDCKFLNRIIDGRDVARYKEINFEGQFGLNTVDENFKFSKQFQKVVGKHKNFFFHDEVHHWSQSVMFKFLNTFQPRRLLFTVVYPTELLANAAQSQNPKMYTFKIVKGNLHFFPDGVTSEGYMQQLNLRWLFEAKYLVDGDRTWTVIKHCSKFAHHLFEIIPGKLHTEDLHVYNDFTTVNMSVMFKNRFRFYDLIPIDYVHIAKVYSYLLCLKKPDLESGLAKLRQILGDDLSVKEFLFFEQFCKRIIERGTSYGLFGHSLFEHLSTKFMNALPDSLARLFPSWKKNNTFEFLFNLGTFSVEVERKVVYSHIIQKCPFEVINLDHSCFIDPLIFFESNENFNEERVDDGYLERVKLPFWNYKGYPWKKETYFFLNKQLERESNLKVSGCPRKPAILSIEWKEPGPYYTTSSLLLNRQITNVDYLKQQTALSKTLKFFVENAGYLCLNSFDDILEGLIYDEPDIIDYVNGKNTEIPNTHSKGELDDENECGSVERSVSDNGKVDNLIFQLDLSSDESESISILKEEDIAKETSVGHDTVEKELPMDYKDLFTHMKCENLHGDLVNVPADGNCFFHAFLMTFECVENHVELRESFANWLENFGIEGHKLSEKIRPDGVYMEHELVYLFAKFRNVHLMVHFRDLTSEPFSFRFGESEGHIFCDGSHFQAIQTYRLNKDLNLNISEKITSGHSDELSKFNFEPEDFSVYHWNGRKSAFVSKVDADYGHNHMSYPFNSWPSGLDEILKLTDPENSYNSALIQWYEKGARIGYHRDNERVYSDDAILTVNLKGEAFFSIEMEGQEHDFIMMPNTFFVMPKGFQKRARHRVEAMTSRLSITFRHHVRKMNGESIIDSTLKFNRKKNCLIQSIAEGLKSTEEKVAKNLIYADRRYWKNFFETQAGASLSDCEKAAIDLGIQIELNTEMDIKVIGKGVTTVKILFEKSHFSMIKESKYLPRSLVSNLHKKGNSNVCSGLIKSMEELKHYTKINYNAESDRAKRLINSFLAKKTGIALGEVIDHGSKYFKNVNNFMSDVDNAGSEIHCLVGFAGSGKSRFFQNWLKNHKNGNFCVVTPRTNLALDWQFKLELEGPQVKKVTTFEKYIKMEKSNLDLVLLDELTLFPNGYLDLIIMDLISIGSPAIIIGLFDVLQARYHNETDIDILPNPHDVDKLVDRCNLNYMYSSFRMGKKFFGEIFEKLQLPYEGFEEGPIFVLPDPYKIREAIGDNLAVDVLLVESQIEKSAYGSSIRCLTFGEAQGLTFDHVCILLSESSAASNELRWFVALTRARERISFCCSHLGGLEDFVTNCKSELFGKFFRKEKIKVDFLRSLSTANLIMWENDIGAGIDEVDREERLEGDPFLKPYIFLGQRINMQSVENNEIDLQEIKCQTHLFISEPNFAQCYNFDLIREKESREYREDMLVTDQFCDNYNKLGPKAKMDTVGPLRFKSIYPKHSADDDMTFWMAVKKRLVFREENENYQRLNNAHLIGGLLYNNFKNKFDLSFQHDQQLLERCRNDFEVKKLQKSQATIKSHSIRSDIDWALNDVFLFMKSQLCTKYEKQFVDAKAGQTLACFQHLILVEFAPWCRYLEEQIRNQLPEEIYIHSNRNFDDLNAWVKNFFQRDICVESDYEAFDASQDEYILSFEIHLMKDAGLPDELIDNYIALKCKLGCKLGHFAVMRFTGEFCTFLFNTLANMAFTLCRYEWRRGQPIAFAGDDMCALNNLPLCHDFDEVFEKISLKAKVERTETPMFCGWRLTPYGIVKEPELVYNRFQVAIEEGKVMECLENYAIEVSYAYSLSERLYEVLKSERQIQYHQAVVRFIVTHIDKLKTKVKLLFEEQSSDEDI